MQTVKLLTPQDLDALAQSPLLEETGGERMIRLAMVVVSLAVLGFVVWAALTKVREMAHAEGEIVPEGYVQVVQHLEGGIITDILVKEGESVKQGQLLLKLNGAGSEEDLSGLRARRAALALQAERLRAYVNNEKPDFSTIDASPALKAEQNRVFEGMLQARGSERDVLVQQIAQKRDGLARLQSDMATSRKNATLAGEARDIQKKLITQGLANRTNYLKREEEVNTHQGRVQSLERDMQQAQKEILEFENRMKALTATSRDSAWQELDRVSSELAGVEEQLKKQENRVGRLSVTSPVNGYVKGLKVNTLGSVVGSGQTLMEIVPAEKLLVVEARISPNDIGHVAVGQKVYVKVDSYDFARYGAIEGMLESLSPTTFVDENRQSYYRGRVRLMEDHLGKGAERHPVIPGMTVDVDIVTGDKSILAYLLKPIQVAASSAFTER